MDRSLVDETREVLRSARAWIEEFSEEGVTSFDSVPEAATETLSPAACVRRRTAEPGRHGRGRDPRRRPLQARVPSRTCAPELGDCTRCGLHEGRQQIVFGDGNPDADLMFVGEGPGENEDRQGLPFVGRAGELLTKMIEAGLEIPRSEVYICNVVKCRPPRNRTPLPDEVSTCRPFLLGQIEAVRPRVIVALGKPATSLLLGRDVAISRVRGTWHSFEGIPVMPTFHPAFVLRQYTTENRRLVWEDLKAALAKTRE